MTLEDYRAKRDFTVTPEPPGEPAGGEGRRFVVQKHAASRLHYDFRLELDGVLLSWAVPKGPSLDPRDKHLAVRVEDHPVEYGSFEGTIPAGEYGGGTVALWDRGTWEPVGDPHAALANGDLKFTLRGEKLTGGWVLVRMRRRAEERGPENWLLIKHRDGHAREGGGSAILTERPESVATGRTIEEITEDRADGTRIDPAALATLPGARPAEPGAGIASPQLATRADAPPAGGDWLHEIKIDGYRAIATVRDGLPGVRSRSGVDWTGRWPRLERALARLDATSAVLDGEIAVDAGDGRTDFAALQTELGAGRDERLVYHVFDLLHLNGYDLTGVALTERKALLRALLGAARSGPLRYLDDVRGDGAAVLAAACELGLEGVVSKRADARYRPGERGDSWRKSKCAERQEFVIVGWTPPSGARTGLGALLLAVNEPDGGLRYVGKVGSGLSDRTLRNLAARLASIETATPPVDRGAARAPAGARWVSPRIVAEVSFTEWTRDGHLRHPVFLGLREDRDPAEVLREAPGAAPAPGSAVKLTHPGRVLWPESGTTKRDLADYYQAVAPHMLPYVLGRPLSMVRCPSGVTELGGSSARSKRQPCFFHKHPGPDFPGPFGRVEVRESGGPGVYLLITEAASLVALAQMGVLEIHTWESRVPTLERPDVMVFDLDPSPETGWDAVVTAARLVRGVLDGLGLTSLVKTTGSSGLHVCVPLDPIHDWSEVKRFSRAVAEAIAAHEPDRYVATMSKAKRAGRVYIDYVRNSRGATFIAPYSTRAHTRPTVSVPLRWDELGGRIRSDSYDIRSVRRRLSHLEGDPWAGFWEMRQRITQTMHAEIGSTP